MSLQVRLLDVIFASERSYVAFHLPIRETGERGREMMAGARAC